MKIDWAKIIIYVIIITVLFGIGFYTGSLHKEIQIIRDTVHDTTYVTKTITIQAKPKFIIKTHIDTIYTDTSHVPIITESKDYYATLDTTVQDSSVDVNITYVSHIPLAPDSFFYVLFNWKEKEINNTPVINSNDNNLFRNFHIGIYAGYGIGIISKRLEPQVGVGISYSF